MSEDVAVRWCTLCNEQSEMLGPDERDAWQQQHDDECPSPLRKLPQEELRRVLNPVSVRPHFGDIS